MAIYSTAGGTVWTRWITSASTTSTTADIWPTWATSTTAAETTTVWTYWCDEPTYTRPLQSAPPPITPEQRVTLERYRTEESARWAEVNRKREEAEARAEKLLVENLSLKQRAEYERHKAFVVHGSHGLRFRVRKGRSGNIDVINPDGFIGHRLCAHPAMSVPDCDTMLAQKLMLECDQQSFMRVANRHASINHERVLPALH